MFLKIAGFYFFQKKNERRVVPRRKDRVRLSLKGTGLEEEPNKRHQGKKSVQRGGERKEEGGKSCCELEFYS